MAGGNAGQGADGGEDGRRERSLPEGRSLQVKASDACERHHHTAVPLHAPLLSSKTGAESPRQPVVCQGAIPSAENAASVPRGTRSSCRPAA